MVDGRKFHLVFVSNTQTYHGSGNNSKGEASLPVTSPQGTLPNGPKKLPQHQKLFHLIDGAFSFAACNAFTEDEPQ